MKGKCFVTTVKSDLVLSSSRKEQFRPKFCSVHPLIHEFMSCSSLVVVQWDLQTSFWLLNVFGCHPLLNYRATKPCMSSREQETPRGMLLCSLNISDRPGTASVRYCLALSYVFMVFTWTLGYFIISRLACRNEEKHNCERPFIQSTWETRRRKSLLSGKKNFECVFPDWNNTDYIISWSILSPLSRFFWESGEGSSWGFLLDVIHQDK